jgi:hypothetical protein
MAMGSLLMLEIVVQRRSVVNILLRKSLVVETCSSLSSAFVIKTTALLHLPLPDRLRIASPMQQGAWNSQSQMKSESK